MTCNAAEGQEYTIRLLMPAGGKSCLLECESRDLGNGTKQWQRSIGAGYAQHLLQQLAAARIPAIPLFSAGLDGETHELTLSQGFNSVTYRWWSDAPKGYEPLICFGNELLQIGNFRERLLVRGDMQKTYCG